jgi:type III restriction enzyme
VEPKKYQRAVLDDLSRFLALLGETGSISTAYSRFWEEKKVIVGFGGIQPYQNVLPRIPNVCLKVPTGGGKTFIASCAIKPIFDSLPFDKGKAVVWLVPSDAILEQTLKNLADPQHPYRQRIDGDFSHRVEVYSKEQLLNGQNFSPTVINEQLSVFVLSYDSIRTSKKEGRKVYQENGNLAAFAKFFNDPAILLADTDVTALIQVIRHLNPVVIVDESHHASTPLSREMLHNFNPSFVLDLTATPRKESNIISYVDALQLKRENMVKLPVIVYNRRSQDDVFGDAVTIRNNLERQAERDRTRTGRYIRPIVLLQAEPRGNDSNKTFEKVKKYLLDIGIPENQIAIKTADRNELHGRDLLSEDCPIRYIITINALKEGWDCPFAYVLATVANRTSTVDVEQILGRILRLPYTQVNDSKVLNISYVITSSNDFHATLERVVAGLNNAGFSERDVRVGSVEESPEAAPHSTSVQISLPEPTGDAEDIMIDVAAVKARIASQEAATAPDVSDDTLFAPALSQEADYEQAIAYSGNPDFDSAPLEVRSSMNMFRMNEQFAEEASALLLPQFVIPLDIPLLSSDTHELLTESHLHEGFSLRGKDTEIDFTTLDAEIARVDVADTGDALPKAWKLTGTDNRYFREWFNSQPSEKRIDNCKQMILAQLSKMNAVNDRDLSGYIGRVMEGLTTDQLEDLQQSPYVYGAKIRHKIESLLAAHRKKTFELWFEQGRITCEPTYRLKAAISPTKSISTFPKSLYTEEEDMNGLEKDVAWELANLPNIKWWHRNISKSGFNINGYINAYPDIIAMTIKRKILLIEPKGDHLENSESREKVEIGRKWQEEANKTANRYRYYMVFRDKDLHISGTVHFNQFMEIVREL